METRKNSLHCVPDSRLYLNKQINLNKGSLKRRARFIQMARIYNVGIVDVDLSTQNDTKLSSNARFGPKMCFKVRVCLTFTGRDGLLLLVTSASETLSCIFSTV